MKVLSILFLSIYLFNGKLSAQVTADFEMDKSSGCGSLFVTFTNNSSVGPGINYTWIFGNGNSVTIENPDPVSATYPSYGTYTVTLIVFDDEDSVEDTATITVFQNPTADFNANNFGCVQHTVFFEDLSVAYNSEITDWLWDFRTGFTDDAQNPSLNYSDTAKHSVFLEVTDSNGCIGSIERENYIDVIYPPDVSFSASPSLACEVPVNIQFTNNSKGYGTEELLTHKWYFGDGDSSGIFQPTHTYTEFGNYEVTLRVSSNYDCQTEQSIVVEISKFVASGTIEQGGSSIQNNDVICAGEIEFTNNSTGTEFCYWIFGDGATSTSDSGTHLYNNPGDYTITLVAGPGHQCADTFQWNITVEKATASFSMTPELSCNSSQLVQFTDMSTNAVSWEWLFADGATSTQQNPSKTYTATPKPDEYALNSLEQFQTSLTVTSQHGCQDNVILPFRIRRPTAIHVPDVVEGCAPLTVNFNSVSISEQAIPEYKWELGNGQTVTGSESNLEYTYTEAGVFDTRLIITNAQNCKDTSYTITIRVGNVPNPDFSVSPQSDCSSGPVQFTDLTPAGNDVDTWFYYADNNRLSTCPNEPNPQWTFKSDTGYFDVKLVAGSNGCYAEIIKENAVYNAGPIGSFTYSFECDNPFEYTFQGMIKGDVDGYKWDFGDGIVIDNNLNPPVHPFDSIGNYDVMFITMNNGCADTVIQKIMVRDPGANIISDALGCAGQPIIFKSTGSHDFFDDCYEKYLWNFNDGTRPVRTSIDSITHVFEDRGVYQVDLLALYDNGCVDNASVNITIRMPYAEFEADTLLGCAPFEVNFTDQSSPDTNPLSNWEWDFGDGNSYSHDAPEPPIKHFFETTGEFNVILTVTDDMGCTATAEETVFTANPDASFYNISSAFICAGNNVSFEFGFQEPDSAIWNFGDGTIVNAPEIPISHTYMDEGNYQVSLTLYKYGCSDVVVSASDFIKVQKANASFVSSDTAWNCYPKEINFTHNLADQDITSGRWEFGHNNNFSAYATQRTYNYPAPGEYNVKLSVETSFGCKDTTYQTIVITGPTGVIDISPGLACKGDEILISLNDTANVYEFFWDLGDGVGSPDNPVTHTYTNVGDIIISLHLTGELLPGGGGNRCAPPPVQDTLHIYEVIADFTMQDTSFCEYDEVAFTNTSSGFTGLEWDFGDGYTTSLLNPVRYFLPEQYETSLRVWNDIGCTDTAFQSIIIHPIPEMTINPDTAICFGTQALLQVTGGSSIQWIPEEGLSSAFVFNPIASPELDAVYTATITDAAGCQNSDSIYIIVQQVPELILSPYPDTTIIVGEIIILNVQATHADNYQWSPADGLSCTDCNSPTAQPFSDISYTIEVSDRYNCFNITEQIHVTVIEEYSVDIPTAFTPDGDGVNDVVYVRGWGIKQLLEFKIYNRWGNLVFSSTDISIGWDGRFNGRDQPIGAYVYVVSVEMYDGQILNKRGTINLLR